MTGRPGPRPSDARRGTTSPRLAREAHLTRLAVLGGALVGVLIVLIVVVGAVWEYAIGPAQPVATVNGTPIRSDVFNRFQKFQVLLLTNQASQLQSFAAQGGSPSLAQQVSQQQSIIQSDLSNPAAYTLSQMETALELEQAAARLGRAPSKSQLDAEVAKQRKQPSFAQILSATGVQVSDLRTYYIAPNLVRTNMTALFASQAPVPSAQPWAKARHILVKSRSLATTIVQRLRHGASFTRLARTYSIDNGQGATAIPISKLPKAQQAAALAAEQASSAYNGGWLRDPNTPTGSPTKKSPTSVPAGQPTWLTPQTGYVPSVLTAILSMKPGEIRVVKSQYGYHVIQVSAHIAHRLTASERNALSQQAASTKYQSWQTSVTGAKNKVHPSNPYTQFPPVSPTP